MYIYAPLASTRPEGRFWFTLEREDAASMVTAGATANTTEGNRRTLGNQGWCVHIHTGNLS